jgi:hypothetical protein
MLVFTGPGGGFGRAQGAGQGLSTGSYRLAFNRAVERAGGFPELELSGTKTFRHTFSTWLADAGIPTRVIAELMGHKPGGPLGPTSRAAPADHNVVTAGYTHTTPAMLDRVLAAVEERLATAVAVAVAAPDRGPAPGPAHRPRRRAAAPPGLIRSPDRGRQVCWLPAERSQKFVFLLSSSETNGGRYPEGVPPRLGPLTCGSCGGRDRDRTCDFCRVKGARAPHAPWLSYAKHQLVAAQRPWRPEATWCCTLCHEASFLANLWHDTPEHAAT